MIDRTPPTLALWLLKQLGSPYHGESLAGDLIEQFHEGRSRAWCWQQVIAAILYARGRCIRDLPWRAAAREMAHLLAGRWPRRTAIKALLLTFGAIALGVGTLAWALSAP